MTEPTDDSTAPTSLTDGDVVRPDGRPWTLLLTIAVAGLEAIALLAYTAGLAISGIQNPGSVSAPLVEVVIYVLFAVGILLVVKGLWQFRRWARTPFVVIQLFGLVVAWTLLSGDGTTIHVVGWVVGAVSVLGLVVAFLSPTGQALQD